MRFLTSSLIVPLVFLAGCGGDSAPPAPPIVAEPLPPVVVPPTAPPPLPEPPRLTDPFDYIGRCADAGKGVAQGTLEDEKNFLRFWIDLTYLWYREVPALDMARYATPVSYFDALKTPLTTASGAPKDRFHFSYADERWAELSRGEELGYGIAWLRSTGVPREWRIGAVEAGSVAEAAGLQRGDRLLTVDGVDFVNTASDDEVALARLNGGLFPAKEGELHRLAVARGTRTVDADLRSAIGDVTPVRNTRVIETAQGKVGYLTFGKHNAPAEPLLADAIRTLRDAGVVDLVLDMRYNGGGLLNVASRVAYMIAGPQATAGKTFELTLANDKLGIRAPMPFQATTQAGAPLPYLGLKRVYILAGPGTCSASESVINALRGIDIDVHLVGGQTCGKPYAFLPTSNCGTTYFAIQYQGVNQKGFGDYAEGFAPTCTAPDDLDHALGSTSESMLRTALALRADGTCPAAPGARASGGKAPMLVPVRGPASEIAIVDRP